MGSYSGGSDWDALPSYRDAARFKPKKRKKEKKEGDAVRVSGEGPKKPLDLILAFDTTGSMRAWVQNVRDKVEYLVRGLLKLLDIRIAFIGVGDHCDEPFMLQPFPFSSDLEELDRNIHTIRGTSGGDYPEAFECLFRSLNEDARWKWERPTVLILITDSVPHGMGASGDAGCPDGVDARSELRKLEKKLKSVYLVNCGNHEAAIRLQKKLVSANAFLQMNDFRRLTNLLMALCMDEVGELDFFMDILAKQRGESRRKEVLSILKKKG